MSFRKRVVERSSGWTESETDLFYREFIYALKMQCFLLC